VARGQVPRTGWTMFAQQKLTILSEGKFQETRIETIWPIAAYSMHEVSEGKFQENRIETRKPSRWWTRIEISPRQVPRKQGLKHGLRAGLNIEFVVRGQVQETGLKQQTRGPVTEDIPQVRGQVPRNKDWNEVAKLRCDLWSCVRGQVPRKQGLKHIQSGFVQCCNRSPRQVPRKQGLKPLPEGTRQRVFPNRSEGKFQETRIETWLALIVMSYCVVRGQVPRNKDWNSSTPILFR